MCLSALLWLLLLPLHSRAQGNGPRPETAAALGRFKQTHPHARVRLDRHTGTVRLVEGRLRKGPPGQAENIARAFLADYGELFGVGRANPAELVTRGVTHDPSGSQSVRFEQRVNEIPVLGSDLRADVDPSGELYLVYGESVPAPRPSRLKPRVTAAQATTIARTAVQSSSRLQHGPHLLVTRLDGRDHLVWRLVVLTDEPARWELLVDAITGNVLRQRDILHRERQRLTYSAAESWNLPGTLVRREGQAPAGDAVVDMAHDNAGVVYDYFWQSFGRDSIDGRGMPIESTVHFRERYNNAFWDGSQLVFGDGDGVLFSPLGHALDVVAHELTHGVTEYSANLTYAGEPGALNEAFSDIFGALIDATNWEIAEAIYTPAIPGDALRSMADPTRFGQPSVWGEYLDLPLGRDTDYGGVHYNSGIINHVAYRLAQRIGREKLGRIAYRTLTDKLTANATFEDARDLSYAACRELVGRYDITNGDCQAVLRSFADGGIGDPPPHDPAFAHRVYLPLISDRGTLCGRDIIRNGSFEGGQHPWPNSGGILGAWSWQADGSVSARLDFHDQLLQLVPLPPQAEQLVLEASIYQEGARQGALTIRLEDPDTRQVLEQWTVPESQLVDHQPQRLRLSSSLAAGRSQLRVVFRYDGGSGQVYVDSVRLHAVCQTAR